MLHAKTNFGQKVMSSASRTRHKKRFMLALKIVDERSRAVSTVSITDHERNVIFVSTGF